MATKGAISITNAYGYIDELHISNTWKTKFKLIYIAYYQNFYLGGIRNPLLWVIGPQFTNLSLASKLNFNFRYNILALIFGPLYYITKGMFKKGIIMSLIIAGALYYNTELAFIIPFIHVYCSYCADIDYFYSKFLNTPIFQNNPKLLSDYFDKFLVDKTAKKFPLMPIFKIILAIGILVWGIIMALSFAETLQYKKYFNTIEKVCKDDQVCIAMTGNIRTNISRNGGTDNDYYKLGCAYYWSGQKGKALESFSKARVENPENIKAYGASAIIYSEMGYKNDAIKTYSTILELKPELTFVYYYMGSTYYKNGNYRKALECFEKVTSAYPNEPIYLEAQAYTKIYLRDNEGAKNDIKKTIQLLEKKGKSNNMDKITNLYNYMQSL